MLTDQSQDMTWISDGSNSNLHVLSSGDRLLGSVWQWGGKYFTCYSFVSRCDKTFTGDSLESAKDWMESEVRRVLVDAL